MKLRIRLSILLLCFSSLLQAQTIERKQGPDPALRSGQATKSPEYVTHLAKEIHTPSADLKWRPLVVPKRLRKEHEIPGQAQLEALKAQKLAEKFGPGVSGPQEENARTGAFVTPVVGTNYGANVNNGSSPMDNSMAVSNGGIIVSVANGTLEIDNTSGINLYYNDLESFLNDPTFTTPCDPVVIYDSGADRFILFMQECNSNSTLSEYIAVCFSKSNNPAVDGWWYYKFTGNPLNDGSWFDYPKLGVSTNELVIGGNLFYHSGNFNQAILYQMEKNTGYAGGSINWQNWYNINGNPFTLCPVSYGQQGTYGPGMYIVASESGGSSNIDFYDLTDVLAASNEQLNHYNVSTTSYSPAGDAAQLGTSVLLDNGDCRVLSGFYLNGIVHFVFHSDIGNGWNGINYNRLDVASLTNTSSTFGLTGTYDYSYPSVVSFASSSTDRSVMIGFGRSGTSIYPQLRVVNCDHSMNWSGSVLVKGSDSYVNQYASGGTSRWGDYFGTSRKHNAGSPTIWMTGSYGTSSHVFNAWNAEIYSGPVAVEDAQEEAPEVQVYPNPAVDMFYVEFDLSAEEQVQVELYDNKGSLVRHLYDGRAHAGSNIFSFNRAQLAAGMYHLKITAGSKIISHEKVVVSQ